ncbi:MAG: polysaccharide pyruvyl transferase family protein [Pseudomonadales bacterium]|nr:polysaccharide pyruvyl transferase family protein [Pseudomonadales bacterium]MCF8014251.1 polysaccharide pyruvyl transferase family protein [Chromatiaceae bacterium]
MKNVAIFGAFDRDNFGDLLFPIILQKFFVKRSDISLCYFGVVRADLRRLGGMKVQGLRQLLACRDLDAVIVAGGEVLPADWPKVYYILNGRMPLLYWRVTSVFGVNFSRRYIRFVLGAKNKNPYIVEPSDFTHSNPIVFYNAVGGSGISNLDKNMCNTIAEAISTAEYISVRDGETKNELESLLRGIGGDNQIRLAPDCAVLVSDYYSKELLSQYLPATLSDSQEYIVFQCGLKYATSDSVVELIFNQLRDFASRENIKIVLLPIGKAHGHDDLVVLGKLKVKLGNLATLIEGNGLLETLSIIAHARAFAGTSLHGSIVAMSYAIPFVPMTDIDSKLPAYLKVWGPDGYNSVRNFEELNSLLQYLMHQGKTDQLDAHSFKLRRASRKMLEEMAGLI